MQIKLAGPGPATGSWRRALEQTIVRWAADDRFQQAAPWLAVLCFGLLSMALGFSLNWDMQNYHLYNAHAWMNERPDDVLPAQVQSFHNPLLSLPFYWSWKYLGGWPTAFVFGCLHATAIFPLRRLLHRLAPDWRAWPWWSWGVAGLGICGPIFVSGLGASMGDNLVAVAALWMLVLLLDARSATALLLAGLLGGLAVAAKLTMSVFAVAGAVALMTTANRRWRQLPLFALGGLLGFGVGYGVWGWQLWLQYGNPFYPYFQDWFETGQHVLSVGRDGRWVAQSVGDALLRPFVLLIDPQQALELKFRDLRPVLLYVAAPLALLFSWRSLSKALRGATLFAFVSILLWLLSFGYYRYVVTVEMLAPALLAALAYRVWPARGKTIVIALVVSQALVRVPDWGRGEPSGLILDLPEFSADSLVVAGGSEPTGYVATLLPDSVPMVRIGANSWRVADGSWPAALAADRIARHSGPLWLVVASREQDTVADQLSVLALRMERCGVVTDPETWIGRYAELQWCRLVRD